MAGLEQTVLGWELQADESWFAVSISRGAKELLVWRRKEGNAPRELCCSRPGVAHTLHDCARSNVRMRVNSNDHPPVPWRSIRSERGP